MPDSLGFFGPSLDAGEGDPLHRYVASVEGTNLFEGGLPSGSNLYQGGLPSGSGTNLYQGGLPSGSGTNLYQGGLPSGSGTNLYQGGLPSGSGTNLFQGGLPSGSNVFQGGLPSGGGTNIYQGGLPSGGGTNIYQGGMPSGGGTNIYQGGMPSGGGTNLSGNNRYEGWKPSWTPGGGNVIGGGGGGTSPIFNMGPDSFPEYSIQPIPRPIAGGGGGTSPIFNMGPDSFPEYSIQPIPRPIAGGGGGDMNVTFGPESFPQYNNAASNLVWDGSSRGPESLLWLQGLIPDRDGQYNTPDGGPSKTGEEKAQYPDPDEIKTGESHINDITKSGPDSGWHERQCARQGAPRGCDLDEARKNKNQQNRDKWKKGGFCPVSW